MAGATVVVGHGPIPFSGGASLSGVRGFSGTAAMQQYAREAVSRLDAARYDAEQACIDRQYNLAQGAFDWITGSGASDSICARSDQLKLAVADLSARVEDPNTSDDKLGEIIAFCGAHSDVEDLKALAKATNALSVTGEAILEAPGTALHIAGDAIADSIIPSMPWWVWPIGGVALAVILGWRPFGAARRHST